jgi:uncharacterized protein (DUF736 family)
MTGSIRTLTIDVKVRLVPNDIYQIFTNRLA